MPKARDVDWYDLPEYYDLVFGEDTELEADFLEALHEVFGRTRGRRALEPACGSARVLLELARRGWKGAGLDTNAAMLEFARDKARKEELRLSWQQAPMQAFRMRGRFDLAFCLVSTFKYLLTERDARTHLKQVASHLKPGGLYVLGFHLTDYGRRKPSRERWQVSRRGLRVTSNLQLWPADARRRRERARVRLRVERGAREELFETHWWFRCYDATQVRRLLRAVPELELCACFDFRYELDCPRALDDDYSDLVLVLRRVAS